MRGVTRLSNFTIGFLILYAPVEIWYSLPALWDPYFLVDLAGMILLIWGASALRRGRGSAGAGILSAAYGWTSANFWRAASDRLYAVRDGVHLEYGLAEICFTTCVLGAAVVGMALSLYAIQQPDTAHRVTPESRL